MQTICPSLSSILSRYVFDNLSCDQAEDLLRQHGNHQTYLIVHHLDPESYGLSIRLKYEFFSSDYLINLHLPPVMTMMRIMWSINIMLLA